jgi:hypothetical protein
MKANLRKKKPLQVLWHIVKVTHFSMFILSFVCYLFLAALILTRARATSPSSAKMVKKSMMDLHKSSLVLE